jgi:hypothetical protein
MFRETLKAALSTSPRITLANGQQAEHLYSYTLTHLVKG